MYPTVTQLIERESVQQEDAAHNFTMFQQEHFPALWIHLKNKKCQI